MNILLILFLLALLFGGILSGAPVAFVLMTAPVAVAFIGAAIGHFDLSYLNAFSARTFGIVSNPIFLAVPLFVLMGGLLERSDIARRMMMTAGALFGNNRGGIAYAVVIVGALLAASTGVIGATIFMLGMIAMPAMMNAGYSKRLGAGVICASGSLGQIIPPSVLLILLTDQISAAYQSGRRAAGEWAALPVSVGDLFAGALLPGLLLVVLYLIYVFVVARYRPEQCPPVVELDKQGKAVRLPMGEVLQTLLLPLMLILIVLGSILGGVATATESAALGAAGALVIAALDHEGIPRWQKVAMIAILPAAAVLVLVKLTGGAQAGALQSTAAFCALFFFALGAGIALFREWRSGSLMPVAVDTARMVAMLTLIVLGASMVSLVFHGLHGDALVQEFIRGIQGGPYVAVFVVMLVIFLLGFILEYVEIIFIVIPIAGPPLMQAGIDPVWFAILISMNLQMSFLTPPFGYALFYFRRVAPAEVSTADIYAGIVPFVLLQMLALIAVAFIPELATWLPNVIYK